MLRGRPEELVRVVLALEERCAVDEPLGRVPDEVGDGLLGVDAQEVLEDVEEGDLLRGVQQLLVDRVEDVEVRGQVHVVRSFALFKIRLKLST